jgi:hypothetical protein
MRNILEATNTYSRGKTDCFSVKPVLSRPQCFCKNLTSEKQASLTRDVLLFLFNTYISFADTSGTEIRYRHTPVQLSFPEKCKVPGIPDNIPITSISINTITAGNPGVDAFCVKQKNNRNIDCTITPIGKLKKNDYQDNEPGPGTLGAATARPGNPVNNITPSANRWKRKVTGAVNQP